MQACSKIDSIDAWAWMRRLWNRLTEYESFVDLARVRFPRDFAVSLFACLPWTFGIEIAAVR
jgi:hypothetical protein